MMEYYLQVLKKYADFDGRARRKEYWMFALFNFIFAFAFGILDIMLFGYGEESIGIFNTVYALAVLIPGLAVMVRRLHDLGKSGWMALILFIPLIGQIWFFVLMVSEGESGANEYGPNPKEGEVNLA